MQKTAEELNQLAARIAELNDRWWRDPATGERIERNMGEMLMLVVSELSECLEGHRKSLMDDHLPHRPMAEVEIADAAIRVFDIAGHLTPGQLIFHDQYTIQQNFGEGLLGLVADVRLCWITSSLAGSFSELLGHMIAFAEAHGLDLWGALEEKLEYNARRKDHTNEARLQPGGKKY